MCLFEICFRKKTRDKINVDKLQSIVNMYCLIMYVNDVKEKILLE